MPNSQILNQQKIHNIFVKMSLKNKMRIFCFYKNKNKKKFHKKQKYSLIEIQILIILQLFR